MRLARARNLLAVGAACHALAACDGDSAPGADCVAAHERLPATAWQPEALAQHQRFLVLLDRPRPDFALAGAQVTRRFSLVPSVAVTASGPGLRAMLGDPRVLAIEPDEGGIGLLTEAEPLIGLDLVKAAGFSGAGISVAIIDSGVDATHPALAGRVADEACFCGNNCCPNGQASQTGAGSALDDNGHGTHVAGEIAAQGGTSPEGGAPGVQLVAVKVLDSNLGFCCMSDVVAALSWVADNHPEVKLVNLSLGANSLWMGDCDALYGVLSASIATLRQNGTLVVAASGNDSARNAMRSPACISSALSVGAVWDADSGDQHQYCDEATTAADQIACYSNASATTDLLAPGGVITSAWLGGGTQPRVGTSHAAPLVTACAATLLQAKPTLTPDALEQLLESTGKPLTDARNGLVYPRVDCKAALDAPLPAEPDAGASEDAGADVDVDGVDAGHAPDAPDAATAPTDAGQRRDAGSQHRVDAGRATSHDDAGPLDDASGTDSEPVADATVTDDNARDAAPDHDDTQRARSIAHTDLSGCACRTLETSNDIDPVPFSILAWLSFRRRKPRTAQRR